MRRTRAALRPFPSRAPSILVLARKRRSRPPCGNVILTAAVSFPLLFALLAFGVDASLAIETKVRQESALQTVQELRMAPSMTLAVKNASDPGKTIADIVMTALREEGYDGSITVWFYEAGAADGLDDPTRRVYAFETSVSDQSPCAFARIFGVSSLEIASSFSAASEPYAEFEAWKPRAVRCGAFMLEAGQPTSRATFRATTLQSMPASLQAEIIGALANND